MAAEKIMDWFKEDEEEYLIMLMSHEKLTIGFAHKEEYDPLFEPIEGKAVRRMRINRIDGGTQIINVNPNKPHFDLPIFETEGRVRGKHAVIYLHDIEGVDFGKAKGEIDILPLGVKEKMKNLELSLLRSNMENASHIEALLVLPNKQRAEVEMEQRAILDKKMRGLYQPPYVPRFDEHK